MRNISSLFGVRGRGVVGLLALVMVAGSVGSAPLPASAACNWQYLTFPSGYEWHVSSQGMASDGSCNDVNMTYPKDGINEDCNAIQYSYRGQYFSPALHTWIPGTSGPFWVTECDNDLAVLLTSVVTGTPYRVSSQQNGGGLWGVD